MMAEKGKKYHQAKIASAAPGRLRIKMHPESRDSGLMDGIRDRLAPHDGVHHVRVNPATGSITVKYDQSRHDTHSILGLMEDLDVVLQSLGHVPAMEKLGGGSEDEIPSAGFPAAIRDLNRRIYGSTGVPVDIKVLLPLCFAGAGIWSIARKGLMIESVPGWLFLWFAFDMFVKLHPVKTESAEP